MNTRTRPSGCCAPKAVKALPDGELQRLAKLAKAIADPNRIEILRLLANQDGPVCACDIVDHVDLSQPTVSHHLKKLKDAGLLTSSRRGLWVFYQVDPEGARALTRLTTLLD